MDDYSQFRRSTDIEDRRPAIRNQMMDVIRANNQIGNARASMNKIDEQLAATPFPAPSRKQSNVDPASYDSSITHRDPESSYDPND